MKHAIIITSVLAASVMPTATADTAGGQEAKAYEIRVDGAVAPSGLEQLGYPSRAAINSRAGACDLSVKVDDKGNIGAVSVKTCSSREFRREAAKLVQTSNADATLVEAHPLRIEWKID